MGVQEITRDAVLRAMGEFDELGRDTFLARYGFGEATRYYVTYDGRAYDSKSIVGVAHRFTAPDALPLRPDEFSGGDETLSVLRRLGFEIVDSATPPLRLRDTLVGILERQPAWDSTNTPVMSERGQLVRTAAPDAIRVLLASRDVAVDDVEVKGGDGVGRKSRVPYIRVYSKRRSPRPTNGWYLVYLFAADGARCYLSLAQGTTELRGGKFRPKPDAVIERRNATARSVLGEAFAASRYAHTHVDLAHDNEVVRSYERGTVAAAEYSRDAMPDDDELADDLHTLLGYLARLYAHEDAERPVHLVLRWNADREPRTIELHKAIADTDGAVWWGKFGDRDGRAAISAERLNMFRAQIAAGVETHAYLYRQGDAWRTTLRAITTNARDIDRARLPSYYEPADCHLFVELADFVRIPPTWPGEHLVLATEPHNRLSDSFRGMSQLFVAYEDSAPPGIDDIELTETDTDEVTETDDRSGYSLDWLVAETLWERDRLEELLQVLDEEGQAILAGPPGTGKTWVAQKVAQYLTGGHSDRLRTVQFHPSYTYEEFVAGLRPVPHATSMTFEPTPGIIATLARRVEDTNTPHVLIVDEMNRANLPRVFGELLYLLEYRDEHIQLQYLADFTIPSDLLLIGTMNTADRSIRSIDVALRRRFEIFECPPDPRILEQYYRTHTNEVASLVAGFEALNAELTDRLDRFHTIGHTFFMADTFTAQRLHRVWARQLAPLLDEYFFDQPDVVTEFDVGQFWPDAS